MIIDLAQALREMFFFSISTSVRHIIYSSLNYFFGRQGVELILCAFNGRFNIFCDMTLPLEIELWTNKAGLGTRKKRLIQPSFSVLIFCDARRNKDSV